MKTLILLSASLILVGCSHLDPKQTEVLSKLEAIKTEMASKQTESVRWAFANKREIESAISQWSSKQVEEARRAEGLAHEVEETIRTYESLQAELNRKRFEPMRMGFQPRFDSINTNADYILLSNKVVEARAPIAEILERRSQTATKYREQFAVEKLVAEYVKDRFDLVVDSSDAQFSRSPVLYRKSTEVLDITDGVIKLLNEKTKQ